LPLIILFYDSIFQISSELINTVVRMEVDGAYYYRLFKRRE